MKKKLLLVSIFWFVGLVAFDKLPIVFRPEYDMTLGGLEKIHKFDSEKFGRVYQGLIDSGVKPEQFYVPREATRDELLLAHTDRYLNSLSNSAVVADNLEIWPFRFIPNCFFQRNLLLPMRYGVGGTLLATDLAFKHGWAINLSGGYHHAKEDLGDGFCFYSDIAIAVRRLHKYGPGLKVLIVDLDVHQGNGYEDILKNDKNVRILDMYNPYIFPGDLEARKSIYYSCHLEPGTKDEEYLNLIGKNLTNAIGDYKPDFIIYNAGTDLYEGDPLGQMNISKEGVARRDSFVFEQAKQNGIPIAMVLSGGYAQDSAEVIINSIKNLIL